MYSECPGEEREICLLYETGRECKEARDHCAKVRGDLAEQTFDAYRRVLCFSSGLYLKPLSPFMLYPEWPHKAYLTISKVERQRRLEILVRPQLSIFGLIRPMSFSSLNEKTAGQWIHQVRAGKHSTGWPVLKIGPTVWETSFRIDWNQSDAELLEAIRRWLKQYRPPETIRKTHAATGSGAYVKRLAMDLKRIGALRLLQVYKWNELPETAQLYVNQADWIIAEKKAKELIDSFPYTRLF
jgi:hypothetical protein